MRIAILTTFRRMPESYSPVNDIRDQIKLLKKYGHEVVFFAQETCTGEGIECEMRDVIPHFRLEENTVNEQMKKRMIDILEKELKDFDVAITHDLMYLKRFYTHRKAIMECNLPNIKWIHWSHSAVAGSLDLKMPHSKYVYMNYADIQRFAGAIGVNVDDIRVIFNDKDPRLFFDWHPISWQIADKVDIWGADIMQTYPLCSTRMNSKGIDKVIKIFSKLKVLGNKVLLIIPNSNARRKKDEIKEKMNYAKQLGLTDKEIFFTSEISKETEGQVPRRVVRDMMQMSNLFIFPTHSEVCSNVLLEASMTKQLIVLNDSFPALFDFGEKGKTCLSYPFGSLVEANFSYRSEDAYMDIAKIINQQLRQSKSNQQFLKIKKVCSIDTIYREQFEPLLVEDY